MENASKALIIAGAILLSILIIGIGMVVYNKAANTLTGTDMTEHQIAAYNSPFEAYIGENVSGSDVRTLVNKVVTHNRNNSEDPSLNIKITNTGIPNTNALTVAETLTNDEYKTSKYPAAKTYKVTVGYEPKSNYIVGIDIKAN